jgi:TatD DNase family protein
MDLVDTHAHIHFKDYKNRIAEVLDNAQKAGLSHIFCVGVDETDSARALKFVQNWQKQTPIGLHATAGLHPHDAKKGQAALGKLAKVAREARQNQQPIVAIGECGLDYFKEYSNQKDQQAALLFQIELARELDLPMVWHVRDAGHNSMQGSAFDDFFKIVDQYSGSKGVVHCFSSTKEIAEQIVERGFSIALNGIMTFTKDGAQLEAARYIPLKNLVLETDCPFLTPEPKRGTINEPANVDLIAKFLAKLRGEPLDKFLATTTANVKKMFKIG